MMKNTKTSPDFDSTMEHVHLDAISNLLSSSIVESLSLDDVFDRLILYNLIEKLVCSKCPVVE